MPVFLEGATLLRARLLGRHPPLDRDIEPLRPAPPGALPVYSWLGVDPPERGPADDDAE